MPLTLDRSPALDTWIAQQPAELIVEVQARLRHGMRIDTVCILSTSPIDSKFANLPPSVIEDIERVMRERLPEIEPGDCLELVAKRSHGTLTYNVTTDFNRARAAQTSAIEAKRAAQSIEAFGTKLAAAMVDRLVEGAEIGMQYDPRDGGAIGFWQNKDSTFSRGDLNVDQSMRRARATYADAAVLITWLAAQSDRTLFDAGFGITREQLERSVAKSRIV